MFVFERVTSAQKRIPISDKQYKLLAKVAFNKVKTEAWRRMVSTSPPRASCFHLVWFLRVRVCTINIKHIDSKISKFGQI